MISPNHRFHVTLVDFRRIFADTQENGHMGTDTPQHLAIFQPTMRQSKQKHTHPHVFSQLTRNRKRPWTSDCWHLYVIHFHWSMLVFSCPLSAVRCSLFPVPCSLFLVPCSLVLVRFFVSSFLRFFVSSFFAARCSLFVVRFYVFRCSLFVVRFSFLVDSC